MSRQNLEPGHYEYESVRGKGAECDGGWGRIEEEVLFSR